MSQTALILLQNLLQPVKGSGGVLQYSYYGMLGYAGHYRYPKATISHNLAALSNITRELQELAGVFQRTRVTLRCGGPAVHTRLFRESNVQAALFGSLANDTGTFATTAGTAATLVVINAANMPSTVQFDSGATGAVAPLTLLLAPWGVAIVQVKNSSHPRCHVEQLQLAGAGLKTDDSWQPEAKLNSVFVSLQAGRSIGEWNASRWTTLVADLKAIQVENIILADCVTESEAWYPSQIPGLTYAGIDVVGQALTAAAAAGLTVFAGLVLPANWFHEGAMNVSYLQALTQRENVVAREIHELYSRPGGPGATALKGFYQPAEIYSTCCYSHTHRCDADHITRLATMLEPTGRLIHTLRPSYLYVIAPFAANVSQAETAWWGEILSQTPSVDILALQDGVGVSAGKRSPTQASELIAAVSVAAREQNVSMWTDVEIFTHPNYTVATTREPPKSETCVCMP